MARRGKKLSRPATPTAPAGSRVAGLWHGHPNYQCEDCPFATLDRAAMADHRRTRHGAAAVPLKAPLVDAGGQPITTRPRRAGEIPPLVDEEGDEI